MKSLLKPVLIASLLAAAGFSALAQPPMDGDCHGMMAGGGPMHEGRGQWHMGKMDPAKMQARMDKHHAELKTRLKITPAQEAAWTAFTAAMTPPADMMAKRPDPAELAKLSTPERIDKMKALRAQHMTDMAAAMDKRGEATKALYAVLSPEQQKAFDTIGAHQQERGQGRRGRMYRQQDGQATPPAKP